VWLQYDIFAEHQFAQGLFSSLVECPAFFRRINKSDTDLDLRFGEDPHFYRIPLHNARDVSGDRHLVQDQGICSGWERLSAKNSKSTGENKQGDEFYLWLDSMNRIRRKRFALRLGCSPWLPSSRIARCFLMLCVWAFPDCAQLVNNAANPLHRPLCLSMKIISCHQNYETQTFASWSDTWNASCCDVNNFFSVRSAST